MRRSSELRADRFVLYRRGIAALCAGGFAVYVLLHVDWSAVGQASGPLSSAAAGLQSLGGYLHGRYWEWERGVFLLLALVAQALYVPLGTSSASFTFAVVLCVLLRFGPEMAVLLPVPAVVCASARGAGWEISKPLYRGGLYFLPILLSTAVYEGLGGNETWAYNLLRFFQADWLFAHPLGERGVRLPYSNAVILLAPCAVFFLANNLLNYVGVRLTPGRFQREQARRELLWYAMAFLASTAGGFLLAVAHANGTMLDVLAGYLLLVGGVVLLRTYHRSARNAAELSALLGVSRSVTASLEHRATLDLILEEVRTLIRYDQGAIFLHGRDGQLRAAAARGAPAPADEIVLRVGQGITGDVARTGRAEVVSDVARDDRNVVFAGFLSEIRSGIFAPLTMRGRNAGVMVLGRLGGEPFSEEHLRTLTRFGAQAAVAIRNAELYEEMRASYEKAAALIRVSSMINSSLELDRILAAIATSARQLARADSTAVAILDEATGELRNRVAEGMRGAPRALADSKVRKGGLTSYALERGETVVVDDLAAETRFHSVYAVQEGVRSAVCCPLRVDGTVVGLLYANDYEVRPFSSDDVEILEALASQAALAVRNAQLYESTFQMAITDPMTRTYNFRYFQQVLRDLVRRHARSKRTLAVALTDLDRFKAVNDTYGHLEGDRVIREMAIALKHTVRETDVLARYAGDEFAVVMPETSRPQAAHVAERMRRAVESRVRAGGARPVTLSVGLAFFPRHARTAEDLVRRADAALYEAKRKGRNRVALARA